ncbi:MAG: hypothetical protein KIT84_43340 [Labilithrix sp.]|nr:hypothetical protein [Labilithrix sp.]MCW5817913.1 hypothetical protein [Labilithrix sp.]
MVGSLMAVGCAVESEEETAGVAEDDLARKSNEHWFYNGPLDALGSPEVTISLTGHTARVRGFTSVNVSSLPHAKARNVGGRQQVDLVYPIATGESNGYNARPREYSLYRATLFRPDGQTTSSFGTSYVTWGGFPFLAYHGGIAMHGPISYEDSRDNPDFDVWYLKRGKVSHGCNRMLGEHVTEVAHVLGMSMRKVYDGDRSYTPPAGIKVRVINEYDRVDGKYVDVDYPTANGAQRPGVVHGASNVAMFGSWVATEMPNGADLPGDKAWEGGVSGDPYVFAEHARLNWVCSMPRNTLLKLRSWEQSRSGRELPRNLCAKKACVISAVNNNRSPETCF